jgi:lysozyme family protein
MTFDEAFKLVVNHEGGYVNHPHDPGGETMYGISKRSHPMEDIKNLTLERAKQIYLRDYWQAAGCDYVPPKARFSLFDTAVNSGVKRAIVFLQRAVGAEDDGIIGPKTLMLLEATPPAVFIARFNGHRLQFMSTLPTWPSFGRGWANRIAANLLEA